ncbi:MAG: hypothetical protein ACLSS9_15380 [Acutalibacteraceae bacterium]
MLVDFTAVGAVTNPYLLDLSTQKQIAGLRHAAGETVQINTNYGKKGVISLKTMQPPISFLLTLDSDFCNWQKARTLTGTERKKTGEP